MLLDEVDGLLVNCEFRSLLKERSVLFKVLLEESSGFGDDGGGFLVVPHFRFEFVMGFTSLGVQFVDLLLIVSGLLLLGGHDTLHDGSSGVEVSFESGFQHDSLLVAFS